MQPYSLVDLPDIPAELIDDIETIKSLEKTYSYPYVNSKVIPDGDYIYVSYKAPDKLHNWLQSIFGNRIVTGYQIITGDLPVHVDRGKSDIKHTYILQTGGESVATRWWDTVDEPRNLEYSVVAPAKQWHTLNIKKPHDITGVTGERIGIWAKQL